MTITIDLAESVLAGLKRHAERKQVTVEELAGKILESAMEEFPAESLEDLVARIKSMPPNPAMIRPAQGNLAEALKEAPEGIETDPDEWNRNWAAVEREMAAITRADDIAEGRRQPD